MLHTLLVLLASQPAPPGPPVKIWLGSGPALTVGVEQRVYVQTSTDGNLVVLHARPDGRIGVLFPGNPTSDPFVRAGTYEIRGPANGAAFAVIAPAEPGILVAALSPDPIWFDEFVQNNTWRVGTGAGADPEAFLTDIVQRMLGDGSFNYDVVMAVPTTFAVRAIPLVARARPTGAAATAAPRSRLLVRYVHSARSHELATPSIVATAPGGPVSPATAPTPIPAPTPVIEGLDAASAATAAPLLVPELQLLVYEPQFFVPEPQCAVRPDARRRAARAERAPAAPRAAQGGLSTGGGVGLGAVRTAGWRH